METIIVHIDEHISLHKGISSEEGQLINTLIRSIFDKGDCVELDFYGVEMATTAFLNVVIGTLYDTYSSEQLKRILSFSHYSESTASRIKRVTDNAKLFYQNEKQYSENVKEVMNGDN